MLPNYHWLHGQIKQYTQCVVLHENHFFITCFLVVPGTSIVLTLLLNLHALHDMHVKNPVMGLLDDVLVSALT